MQKQTVICKTQVHMNAYSVIQRAVEDGIRYGIMRAHKHTSKPTDDQLQEEIERGVTNELCEVLRFDDDADEGDDGRD